MTQEEKQLLLIDLALRLPYGVKCRIKGERSKILIGIDPEGLLFRERTPDKSDWCYNCYDIEEWSILPYLRPLSSMTEEENKEFQQVELKALEGPEGHTTDSAASSAFQIDFYNKHHFDYRGLIPLGLALEAPAGMYA